jgi:hypothetical protein
MWTAVGLATLAALFYILMELNILGVGDLKAAEKPEGITYFAAGCYILGGLLILLRKRGLLIFGAVINAAVMFFFFSSYLNRPAVMFSPGGMVSKSAQILLEVVLLYLIFTKKQK